MLGNIFSANSFRYKLQVELRGRAPRQEAVNWGHGDLWNSQVRDRDMAGPEDPWTFPTRDCKGIKVQSFLCFASLLGGISLTCCLVTAPWLNVLGIWMSVTLLWETWSRADEETWSDCEWRGCSWEGASVPAQVVRVTPGWWDREVSLTINIKCSGAELFSLHAMENTFVGIFFKQFWLLQKMSRNPQEHMVQDCPGGGKDKNPFAIFFPVCTCYVVLSSSFIF